MKNAVEEKYRDKVTPEHRAAMEAIGFARMFLNQHRELYEQLLKAEQDMHSFGGMLDPTLYRDMLNSEGFKQQTRMVKAALAFMKELDAVVEEIRKDAA